jgi:predicted alpha/beta superfamily hydrolase
MKGIFLIMFQLLLAICLHAQVPSVAAGRIIRHDNFSSSFVPSRNIDVWLPDGYDPSKKYAVLYMHDGQMLFDKTITWNKQAWDVDDVANRLEKAGQVIPFIVVGIWNSGATRRSEYFPQKAFESLTPAEKEDIRLASTTNNTVANFTANSDNYLRFLVNELKPFIDSTYATLTDRANTFVAGSSMGGLISMYAICEYPDVFGAAACLSTHWTGIFQIENNPVPQAFYDYLISNLPNPENHKIYFDFGDQTLDSLYPTLQKQVDIIMTEKGFTNKNWITKFFPGKDHSEKSWAERFNIPLEFVLKK